MVIRRLPRHVILDRSKWGQVRYYFRRKGEKKVRLPDDPNSEAFTLAYLAAMRGEARPRVPAPKGGTFSSPYGVIAGSFRELCVEYLKALADDETIAQRTKYIRRRHLDETCQEVVTFSPGTPKAREFKVGDLPLERVTAPVIQAILDRRKKTPEAANDKRKCLSIMYSWAVPRGRAKTNPVRDTLRTKNKSRGHIPWTVDDIEAFAERHPPGTKPYLALALLLFTDQRVGDVVRFGRQHLKDGKLHYRQQKTGQAMKTPVHEVLQKALNSVPPTQLTFLVTSFGKPFSAGGFSNWFHDRIVEAGLKGISAHGLRKGLLNLGPKYGVTPHELMAISGHVTLKEIERYTREFDREQQAEAGMKKLHALQIGNKKVPGPETQN